MRILLPLLPLMLLLAQEPATPSRFAGTWDARPKGTVICSIRLEWSPTLSGFLDRCKLDIDAEGNVTNTEPSDSEEPEPILNPAIRGDTLTFETSDAGERIRFELTLSGSGQADLRITVPEVRMKPLRFVRR